MLTTCLRSLQQKGNRLIDEKKSKHERTRPSRDSCLSLEDYLINVSTKGDSKVLGSIHENIKIPCQFKSTSYKWNS